MKSNTYNFFDDKLAWVGNNSEPEAGRDSASGVILLNNSLSSPPQLFRIDAVHPVEFCLPVYGYIMPFLLIVTVIANTLIILVLSKKHMRTPTNMVLLSMALADLLTLLFPAPWFFYLYTLGNHAHPIHPIEACYTYVFMQEVMPNLFHTASIWLTLGLAIQRYIYVCHPVLAVTWCSLPRVKWAIGWIFFLATLHQVVHFLGVKFIPMEAWFQGRNVSSCSRATANWVMEITTMDVYFNIYYWFRVLFVHTIPCIILVLLNLLLFAALRAAEEKRKRLLHDNRNSRESRKMRDSQSTTFMLIVVVTVFLIVEIPLAVITTLHIISVTAEVDVLDYNTVPYLILFSNFFIACSYPINFAIYCGMSKQFRQTFSELFISNTADTPETSRYSVANGTRTTTNETML